MKNIRIGLYLLICITSLGLFSNSYAADQFSKAQKTEIGQIVHEYMLANPELLAEVSQALQKKIIQTAISSHAKDLFTSNFSPVSGNKGSKLKIVEFFDYQCGVCKRMDGTVKDLLAKNKDVQLVYKELPILGKPSILAAKAALASKKQNKFVAFHRALMEAKGPLDKDKIFTIAKTVGLKTAALEKDMEAPAVDQELKHNMTLARQLGLRGTPAFIIGNYPASGEQDYAFVPGAAELEDLQTMLNNAKQ